MHNIWFFFPFSSLLSFSWNDMAAPNNVELEAAKFLHKLIQDSKDEPAKLATKLYVVSILFYVFSHYFFKCAIYLEFVILYLFVYDMWFLQILQHMKSSGKEHSMPYQVISRCVITNSLLVYSILVAFCGKCWGIFLGWSGNSFNEPLISSHEVNLVALYFVIHILCDLTFCLFEWKFVCG